MSCSGQRFGLNGKLTNAILNLLLVIATLGKSKAIRTPGEKREFEDREDSPDLTYEDAFRFRAIVARGNYLAQDRTDVQYAVKELSRRMSTPKGYDWASAKRLGRYLANKTRSALHFGYQEWQTGVTVGSDTDFAGCRDERKSTSGGVIMFGGHCLKSWSLTHKVAALSFGETEY